MKRLLITLLLSLLAVAAVVLWRCAPMLFPSSEVSDLYRRYEHNPCIRATELHNFRVNDTLAVDALLLEASTDSAFYALLLDFGTAEELIELYKSDKEHFVGKGRHSIMLFYVDKNNPKKRLPPDNPDSRPVIGSIAKRSLCMFMTDDNRIEKIIELSEIKKLKPVKNKQNENQLQISNALSSADPGRHRLPERQ